MPSLLQLPTELLARIVALAIPNEYEPLMMTCKSIFDVGETYREKHNRLARRFKHFRFGVDIPSSWDLVGAIAEQPQIAECIKTAYLYNDGSWEHRDEGANWNELMPITTDDRHVPAIERLLGQSEYLESVSAQEWLERMMNGTQTAGARTRVEHRLLYSTTFLLTLLPNVEALSLPKLWEGFYYDAEDLAPVRQVLHNIVRTANNNTRPGTSLAKLTHLHPNGLTHGYEEQMGLRNIGEFLALPSMNTVTTVSCIASDDCNSGIDFSWPIPGLESPVNTLELYASIMEGPETAKVFEHMDKLQSLRFSHETKWHGCGHEWHVEEFFDALEKRLGHTLLELSVTITNYFEELPSRVATLQGFTQLQELEIDVRMFGIPSTDPSIWKVQRDPDYSFTIDDIPCLADILPQTIQTVRILTGLHQDETAILYKLFDGFKDVATTKLPFLESVIVTRGLKSVGSTRCPKTSKAKLWPKLWSEVRKLLEDQGYTYREVDEARAEWITNLFVRFPYLAE